jgi:ribonuclease HI
MSTRLEFGCANNQAEYEALLTGLEMLVEIEAKRVEVFDDLKFVMQQMKGESQCLDGVLDEYQDKCIDIIESLAGFSVEHIPWEANSKANMLAQQASGYDIR